MFGVKRRFVLRFEWDTLCPNCVSLPVRAQRLAIGFPRSQCLAQPLAHLPLEAHRDLRELRVVGVEQETIETALLEDRAQSSRRDAEREQAA